MTSVAFHRLLTITLSGVTGNQTVLVSPQNSQLGSLYELGDQFDLFRATDLEYRIHPMDPADTDQQSAFYVPDIDVQTVTPAVASSSPIAAVQSRFSGVPSAWVRVPRSQLKGMLDWYKCTADAGAAEFEGQGLIILAGGLSDVMTFEVRGVMQFKNPVSETVQMTRTIDRLEKLGIVQRLPPPLSVASTPGAPAPSMQHRRMGA